MIFVCESLVGAKFLARVPDRRCNNWKRFSSPIKRIYRFAWRPAERSHVQGPRVSGFCLAKLQTEPLVSAHITTAKLVVDAISPNDPNWWLARHPQHKPHDPTNPADTGSEVASFTIDTTTLQRAPNPPVDSQGNAVVDKGFTN